MLKAIVLFSAICAACALDSGAERGAADLTDFLGADINLGERVEGLWRKCSEQHCCDVFAKSTCKGSCSGGDCDPSKNPDGTTNAHQSGCYGCKEGNYQMAQWPASGEPNCDSGYVKIMGDEHNWGKCPNGAGSCENSLKSPTISSSASCAAECSKKSSCKSYEYYAGNICNLNDKAIPQDSTQHIDIKHGHGPAIYCVRLYGVDANQKAWSSSEILGANQIQACGSSFTGTCNEVATL